MLMLFFSEFILVSTKMMNRSGMGRVLTEESVFTGAFILWSARIISGKLLWVGVNIGLIFVNIFLFPFSSAEVNNGLKKEVSSKDVARIWVNDDMKMRSFSPVNVRLFICI